jgi:hypothetical protein
MEKRRKSFFTLLIKLPYGATLKSEVRPTLSILSLRTTLNEGRQL